MTFFILFLFQQIKLPFLMVGHTHEDADQMFLRMSVHIARKSVRTLPILLDLAREAYHSMPNVQHLDNIWDYRQMEISSKSSTQQPPPVQIRERRGKMLMHFKEWPLKSTTYEVIDVTSLAAAYQNEPEQIQQVAEKEGRFLKPGMET